MRAPAPGKAGDAQRRQQPIARVIGQRTTDRVGQRQRQQVGGAVVVDKTRSRLGHEGPQRQPAQVVVTVAPCRQLAGPAGRHGEQVDKAQAPQAFVAAQPQQLRQAQRHQFVDSAHMPIGQRAAEQQRQHALGDRLHVLQAVGAQPRAQEVEHQGAALHHGHALHVGPLRGDARRQTRPAGRHLRQHPGGAEGTGAQSQRGTPGQAAFRAKTGFSDYGISASSYCF